MTVCLVVYALGVLFGGIGVKLSTLKKRSGDIIVSSDEDGIYLSLQIKSLENITSNKEVTLGVLTRK